MDDEIQGGAGEDELSLPKATIAKLITEMLPADVQCSKEARDLMLECCVEFVHLLASEATTICEKSSKKTIGTEHMLAAFKSLGYESYIEQVMSEQTLHTQEQKERGNKRSAASRFGDTGMTQEELAEQQAQLFKAAREKFQLQRVASTVNTPVTEQPPQILPIPGAASDTVETNPETQ